MTEQMGEHPSHHSSKKDGDFSSYVLPVSILLAAVIMGYSMVSAANTLGESWSGTLIPAGNGEVVPNPGDGELVPTPSLSIAELSEDSASKLGSDSAPVVMVEYSDMQCPFCRRHFEQTHNQLVTKYVETGKLQIVFKDFPLSFHPMATVSANATRCAGDQGKYWEMHDKMFIEQAKGGTGTVSYTLDDIKTWGADLGLDASTFNSCVDSDKYAAEVQANFSDGAAAGVSGTPSFFIGLRNGDGQLIVGAQPYSSFESTIEALLQ